MLNKELSHLSESSRSGNMISEYICTTFLGKLFETISILYIQLRGKVPIFNYMLFIFAFLDKNHEMDLLTSHQVDATVDEEPSEYDEEEENQVDGVKPTEASSNNVTNTDSAVVPKVSDNNKTSSTSASTAAINNKNGNNLIVYIK